jgi:hypothetical protein
MSWTTDDAGDLINLDHIELITILKLDLTNQAAPEGATHELLAINADQESYRLTSGTEEECTKERSRLAHALNRNGEIV